MRTTVIQSVEISTLKTCADLPIQIRIRRSTSGQAVRLTNAIASPSHTRGVDIRCWRTSAKYVTRAPILICRSGPSRQRRTSGAHCGHELFLLELCCDLSRLGYRAVKTCPLESSGRVRLDLTALISRIVRAWLQGTS